MKRVVSVAWETDTDNENKFEERYGRTIHSLLPEIPKGYNTSGIIGNILKQTLFLIYVTYFKGTKKANINLFADCMREGLEYFIESLRKHYKDEV